GENEDALRCLGIVVGRGVLHEETVRNSECHDPGDVSDRLTFERGAMGRSLDLVNAPSRRGRSEVEYVVGGHRIGRVDEVLVGDLRGQDGYGAGLAADKVRRGVQREGRGSTGGGRTMRA